MNQTTSKFASALREVEAYLLKAYQTERGVHAETVLGACAAICGEFVLRGSTPHLPETGWIVSDGANGLLFEDGERLTVSSVLKDFSRRMGVPDGKFPDFHEVLARTASAIGGDPFPPLTIPKEHYPHEWSPNACFRHRKAIMAIRDCNGLSDEAMALVLAASAGALVEKLRHVLDPEIALLLIAEIATGTTKMAPLNREF